MKNVKTKMKNWIEGFNSWLDQVEEKISDLKNRAMDFIQSEKQKERREWDSEDSFRDL